MGLCEVEFTKKALKEIKKLDKSTQKRIKEAIFKYSSGEKVDVKKLSGSSSEYRLRVGKYRILLRKENNTLIVYKIKTRGDVYKEEAEKFLDYVKTVLNGYKALLEEIDKCTQKYAVADKDGKIKHFKGRPGVGERFRNCILYFQCKGYSEEKSKKICGLIAQRKCQSGSKYACGIRK